MTIVGFGKAIFSAKVSCLFLCRWLSLCSIPLDVVVVWMCWCVIQVASSWRSAPGVNTFRVGCC